MILYNDLNQLDWRNIPFPKSWLENVLYDKTEKIHGYLRIKAYDVSKNNKLIYEFGDENQIMYWFKHAYSMLECGVFFCDVGEHKGYEDGTNTRINESNTPPNWKYIISQGQELWATHTWRSTSNSIALQGSIPLGTQLYPFFPTKMRFGTGGPVDITTPINPSETGLNDPLSRVAGNTTGANTFIFISRTQHIALTSTGYNENAPSGYYSDFGSPFRNITIYQITMPASTINYDYDGKTLNEAGLYCDAGLVNTKSGLYDQPYGMILAKRYFSPIQKTNTISINFQWSIVK